MPERSQTAALVYTLLPAEVRLLLACARWPQAEADAAEIRALGSSGVDWDSFLELCAHHRLTPLVYRALSATKDAAPPEILSAMKAVASENALSVYRYLQETRRLCEILGNAGVAARVLKGVPLSQQIFADPSLRHVGDIDLLIPPGTEGIADGVLAAQGFRRQEPAAALTPRRRHSWSRHGKDYTYRAEHIDFEVDLHWRLLRNPHMPGNGLADVAGETAQLGETALAVLPLDRAFLYLCVHGSLDGWFRFKSLADVAALWRAFAEERRSGLTALAADQGVLPELAAALLLARDMRLIEAVALGPAMEQQAETREAQWILAYTRDRHLAQSFQPTQDGAGSWRLKRYEWGLRRGFAYRAEIVRRVLLRPRVWEQFALPDAFFPLYILLSPLEWLLFHGARARGRWRTQRWRALPAARRRLLLEAFAWLLAARCGLRVLPVRWIFHWLERPVRHAATHNRAQAVEGIRWAVITMARYGPLSFVCFPQALAAHAMLRRRGIASILHYGVRRSADRRMRAHTWLEVDRRMLLGGESALLFSPIHSTGAGREGS